MVRPNFIPRTLIGVGGVRLFNIPGVIYPDEMLHAKPGVKKKDGKPYNKAPEWGITSKEAAVILGCSLSAARTALHKNRVNCRLVHEGSSRRLYWRKTQVEKLAAERLPLMKEERRKLVNTQEATQLLGISRSTLQRYYQSGKLKGIRVRYHLPKIGPRIRTYFLRAQVQSFAARLNAQRKRAEELDRAMDEAERRIRQQEGRD